MGSNFQNIDSGAGALEARLPFGLYAIRIRTGRQFVEKVLLLDADWPTDVAAFGVPGQSLPVLPTITSAAPLPETAATHETQRAAVTQGMRRVDVHAGTGARLIVMARMYTPEGTGNARPWTGVAVLDANGRVVADLEKDGVRDTGPDPFAVCSIDLSPGAYVLRQMQDDGKGLAQSLVLPPNDWQLEAYLLDRPGFSDLKRARVTLLMRKIGALWGTVDDQYRESPHLLDRRTTDFERSTLRPIFAKVRQPARRHHRCASIADRTRTRRLE